MPFPGDLFYQLKIFDPNGTKAACLLRSGVEDEDALARSLREYVPGSDCAPFTAAEMARLQQWKEERRRREKRRKKLERAESRDWSLKNCQVL